LSFFNTHYDSWCYLPMMGFVSFNDEAEQYLCAAVLRPGNVTAPAGAVGILRRLLMMVRHFFPGVGIRIRLDGGFAHPALLDFLDAEPNLEYVVAMAKNAVLQRKAEEAIHPTDEDLSVGTPAMQVARVLAGVTGETEHVYSEANYAAGCASPKLHPTKKSQVLTVRSRPIPQPALGMESYETKGRRHFGEAQQQVCVQGEARRGGRVVLHCVRGELNRPPALEISEWMFDSGLCSGMKQDSLAYVSSAALLELTGLLSPAVDPIESSAVQAQHLSSSSGGVDADNASRFRASQGKLFSPSARRTTEPWRSVRC
jgi:hypothetical protein